MCATLGPIRDSSFFAQALGYCLELFWGRYGGDWEATYTRWSTTLGIPDLDKNSWADSCPKSPGFDELGNYMTYSSPVCFAALGHFTVQQALRAHEVASELNPVMYGWGQYAAAQQNAEAAQPPQLHWTQSPSLETSDGASCRASLGITWLGCVVVILCTRACHIARSNCFSVQSADSYVFRQRVRLIPLFAGTTCVHDGIASNELLSYSKAA